MKKLIFALLACAALVGFAGCSNDDEEQDVNVVSVPKETTQYFYKVTGTYKHNTDSAEVTLNEALGVVTWSNNTQQTRNGVSYSISLLGNSDNKPTYTKAGETEPTIAGIKVPATIVKMNGKYYRNFGSSSDVAPQYTDYSDHFTGTIGGSSFTYTDTNETNGRMLNVTFERY